MALMIRLLGRPSIEIDGDARSLAGQKPWALLARLLLAPGGATRRELAERIWPEAEDPLAATRWAVLQVRRALAPAATLGDDNGRLVVQTVVPLVVDALQVLQGSVELEQVEFVVRGDLLEGMAFDDEPDVEQWLLFERARLASASNAALRWAATLASRRDPERALRLLDRALARHPFDDAAHELVVDIHVAQGRRAEALAHLALAERRYRHELGAEPPGSIRRPLDRPAPPLRPDVRPDLAARALLEAAGRRLEAGDYAGAEDAGRRAAAEAAASGEELLEARALATLAGILIHSVRGRDREAVGLLDRALRLALDHDEALLAAEVERELGYVAFLDAKYGAAESTLRRAIERSRAAGDEVGAARAMTILGACQSDRAAFNEAEATLTDAVDRLADARDRWEAFARSFLARVRLRTGRAGEARAEGALSVARLREVGWLSLVPWPMVVEAEAELHLRRALELAENLPLHASTAAARLAMVLVARGNLEAAEPFVERALDEAFPSNRPEAGLAKAELAAARGAADAAAIASEALALAEQVGYLAIVPRLRQLALAKR